MRILFVDPYFVFPELVFETLPIYLAARGHEVDILTYARNPKEKRLYASLRYKRMKFHCLDAINISIPRHVTAFPIFLSLKSAINELQPDIIHANGLPFFTTYQAMRQAKKSKKPGVVQVHGVIGQGGFIIDTSQKLYIRSIGYRTFEDATKVLCLTPDDADTLVRYGCSQRKIRVIRNGVDIRIFRPHGKETRNLIAWGGRFVPQKGLEYLIKALQIVYNSHRDIKLIMTGDGPLLPRITNLVKQYGLTRNVVFMGRVDRHKIPSILSKVMIYVLPSLSEGMPYALLEAMACGKAVIGSDIPGISDVITDGLNGILVPARDPIALANEALRLIESSNTRQRIGRNARRLMVEKYSWDKVTDEVEEVYHEALRARR